MPGQLPITPNAVLKVLYASNRMDTESLSLLELKVYSSPCDAHSSLLLPKPGCLSTAASILILGICLLLPFARSSETWPTYVF